jgi:RNA polymerase sigma factor (sigma-70 family)
MRQVAGIAGASAHDEERGAPRPRLLSRSEERAVLSRAQAGDRQARQELAQTSLGLVHVIASEFSSPLLSRADLIQEGVIGLLEAIDRFDLGRGLRFSTYAGWCIRRSMHDAVTNARPIRIPARAARQLAAIRSAESDLEAKGCQRPSDAQLAEAAGLRTSTVRNLRAAPFIACSLDEASATETAPLRDCAEARADSEFDDPLAVGERTRHVTGLLALLPDRHREVLMCHYGLGRDRPMSHREVGRRIGVGEARSRQLEREALHRLRSIFCQRRNGSAPA